MMLLERSRRGAMNGELFRYMLNGAFATTVHYGVLSLGLDAVELSSAGVANLIASVFGIVVSFMGSRYFVFCQFEESIIRQAARFGFLYFAIAFLHGALLFIWTDRLGYDYRLGFLLATFFQMVLSYSGNKILVFR
jgi:putative flippase GtrA